MEALSPLFSVIFGERASTLDNYLRLSHTCVP